jgi:hypothetical protein
LNGATVGQYIVVEQGGLGDFTGASLESTVSVQGEVQLHGTTATSSLVDIVGQGQVLIDGGSVHDAVKLSENASLTIEDAGVNKLFVYVSPGYVATVDGLAPGVGTGQPVVPGQAGGPSLTLNQGDIASLQLWVQGEADIRNSTVDDYAVIEGSGIASFTDTTFTTFLLFRGDSVSTCTQCESQGFLYSEANADMTMDGGTIGYHAALRGDSNNTLTGVTFNGTVNTLENAVSSMTDCFSATQKVVVGGNSTTGISGSELYGVNAVEQGILKEGVMYECIKNNIPYVLAGSIRDDGPLPDVITDVVKAQEMMRELLKGKDMVLMLSTMLHSIATGNLLPSWVKTICVDINPAVVTKLMDRGTSQALGIVTDVGVFLPMLVEELEKLEKENRGGEDEN